MIPGRLGGIEEYGNANGGFDAGGNGGNGGNDGGGSGGGGSGIMEFSVLWGGHEQIPIVE